MVNNAGQYEQTSQDTTTAVVEGDCDVVFTARERKIGWNWVYFLVYFSPYTEFVKQKNAKVSQKFKQPKPALPQR